MGALRDGTRQGDGITGSVSASAPSMAELAAALQAAERQPQLLRQVELACVAAAEPALSQVRCWLCVRLTCWNLKREHRHGERATEASLSKAASATVSAAPGADVTSASVTCCACASSTTCARL